MKITRNKRMNQQVSRAAIIKSIASSTAIEAGTRPHIVENKLKTGTKYRHLSLGS
ncbi:hypothetical protein [Marinimicrobium sp. C2-29]|uniref:hypothetical protein n=1 Tax=Marinimicrobium sp. C2-29 TaxID=3139825 RepID=UPI003139A67C